jgi:alpha-ketoglutarate-dependent taurine dioxygenase
VAIPAYRGRRVRQEVRKEPEQTKAIGEGWHTDMTCFDEPPKATLLFCQEVPRWGGETWHFAVNDCQGQRRVMHRILLAGSKPNPAS